MSKRLERPLSTLKLNASILKELGLVSFSDYPKLEEAGLTEFGKFVIEMLDDR